MAETEETGGESVSTETTGESVGKSAAPAGTTGNGTEQSGESFFDYESIKGTDLEPAYKNMQGSYARKSDELKKGLDKIKQYDQFMVNPVDTMRQLAQQYGYQMVQGEMKSEDGTPKSYNNWEEVRTDFKESIRAELMQELQPMFGEMQNMKKQNVEQALDNSFPDWRNYEDQMMENLQAHPTLVNDHKKLYQMSVPAEVLEARATKAALAKIQDTTEGRIQGQSTTTQQITKKPVFKTINEAATWAAQQPEVKALR